MSKNFKEAIEHRRSYYSLCNKSTLSDKELKELIDLAVLNVPSPFNSQSARIVLLLGENHLKLWDITKAILKKKVSAEAFPATESKIDGSFASGYGTILYYEDEEIVEGLQKDFPSYREKFGQWSEHTSAMHQFAIWTMLEDAGMGASLQHYNPLIDQEVARTWEINPKWRLIAQMPFGVPTAEPGKKEFAPLDKRVLVF